MVQKLQAFEKMYYCSKILPYYGLLGPLGVDQISQAPGKSWILIPPNFSESIKWISYGKHLQLFVTVVKNHQKSVKTAPYPSFDPPQSPREILRIFKCHSNYS